MILRVPDPFALAKQLTKQDSVALVGHSLPRNDSSLSTGTPRFYMGGGGHAFRLTTTLFAAMPPEAKGRSGVGVIFRLGHSAA
jgi:hypothetical protein